MIVTWHQQNVRLAYEGMLPGTISPVIHELGLGHARGIRALLIMLGESGSL